MTTNAQPDIDRLALYFMPVIADVYMSKVEDEATRSRIERGLALALAGKARRDDRAADRTWHVTSTHGEGYTVRNGKCPCKSAAHGQTCKHRYAIGITLEAAKAAQDRATKARYATLNGTPGLVWPVADTDLVFVRLEAGAGQAIYLDPASAFGKEATLEVLGWVLEA